MKRRTLTAILLVLIGALAVSLAEAGSDLGYLPAIPVESLQDVLLPVDSETPRVLRTRIMDNVSIVFSTLRALPDDTYVEPQIDCPDPARDRGLKAYFEFVF